MRDLADVAGTEAEAYCGTTYVRATAPAQEQRNRLARLTGDKLFHSGVDEQHRIERARREAAIEALHRTAAVLDTYEGDDFGYTNSSEINRKLAREFHNTAVKNCEALGIDVRAELAGHGYHL